MATIQELAFDHPLILRLLDGLQVNQVLRDLVQPSLLFKPTVEEIKKGGWLASILANSESEEHKQRAQTIAKLLYLDNPEDRLISKLCYVILSRTGNLLATKFLETVFVSKTKVEENLSFSDSYNPVLEFELGFKRLSNLIELQNDQILTTDFQRNLWTALNNEKDLSISAPTSGGKSFIIQQYLRKCFYEKSAFVAIYIVPTKALISQVTQSFTQILHEDVAIVSGLSEKDKTVSMESKTLFVVTPERCMRLLQQGWADKFQPDFVFVDEIQNIERQDSRGLLLEFVIREISQIWSNARLVLAGPMIQKLSNLFQEVTNKTSNEVATSLSPVFQIKVAVKPSATNSLRLVVFTGHKRFSETAIESELNLTKAFSKSHGKALSEIAYLLGSNSQNIIYAPRTDYAEKWCKVLVETLREKGELQNESKPITDLINFITEEIHPLYFLKDFLRFGVGFHHSKLPDVIRDELEDLYVNRHFKFLICTSTLLEGVNLPASKIFLIYPNKDQTRLSKFDFGNLIGRAGRIKDSLYGTIVGLERPIDVEANEWTSEYFESTGDKELASAVKNTLLQKLDAIRLEHAKPVLEIEDKDIANSLIALRLKGLKSRESLIGYLRAKLLAANEVETTVNYVMEGLDQVSISYDLVRLNPTIDPILQDQLYKRIIQEGVKSWVVTSNNVRYMAPDEASKLPLHEQSLFHQLVNLYIKLDEIFKLESETYNRFRISMRVGQMVFYGFKWMQGFTLGKLIKNDIEFYSNHSNAKRRINKSDPQQVNERINEVIKIQSSVVSFILVKYMKLLNDILETILTDAQKEEFSFSLSLPTKLELGTMDLVASTLISAGLSRNLALKIASLVPIANKDNPVEWLKNQRYLPLHSIYLKHLRRRKFIL